MDQPTSTPGQRGDIEGHDEVAALRMRVAELERERDAAEFQAALYEAMVFGLGRTLSLYDPASVRILVREIGGGIREYLDEVGYPLESGDTVDEVIEKTVAFFVAHRFVDLEVVKWDGKVIHARWHRLLGLRAYERIVAAGGETFISCPLNAVLHDGLMAFRKALTVRSKKFDLENEVVESWEEIVDVEPKESLRPLSLDAERVFRLERERSRQLRVRDEFIRIASHELSTPLTSTKLALARLEKDALPEKAERSIAVLRRQIRRIEQLVAEMLDTTRIQIGRLRLERAPCDLVQIAGRVVEFLQPADQPGAGQVHLHGASSIIGKWDAARLDQIVTNLLTNAIKYGQGRAVDVEAVARDGTARLVVRDQGIGIAAEAIGRIFKPFERAAPVETYGGLGLGLYIARRFVEMHGGTLGVESALGEGATFTVDLPLDAELEEGVIRELPVQQLEMETRS